MHYTPLSPLFSNSNVIDIYNFLKGETLYPDLFYNALKERVILSQTILLLDRNGDCDWVSELTTLH